VLDTGGDDAPRQGDFDDLARGDLVGATDHHAVGSADDCKAPLHHVLGRQRASMALKCTQDVLARCKARHHRAAPIACFEPLAAAFSSMARVLARKPVTCMAQPAPGSFQTGCQRPADLGTLEPFPPQLAAAADAAGTYRQEPYEIPPQPFAIGDYSMSRHRWRPEALVGNLVAQRPVRFMTDR
jgi:hypothetical protein